MRDPNQKITVHKDGRVSVETVNKEPSMAQQQYKDECDINNIMKKYSTTGEFTHLTSKEGRYADFSQIESYQEMLDTVRYAQDAFASLPAETRSRFRNDPGQLLEFVQNPENYDEGVKLGLVQPKPDHISPVLKPNDLNDTKTKPKAKVNPASEQDPS